jgi:hypothetical protein
LAGSSARAQTTERVSVDSAGAQGDGNSYWPSISGDGRFVAFQSFASNLVAGDTNGSDDVFVYDRQNRTTERVSVDSAGAQGNGFSGYPSISADGRFVAFLSAASNLVTGDTNAVADVFVHDRQSGTTERVSVDSSGAQGNNDSNAYPSLSDDGRFVAFGSRASNLVMSDTNGSRDVFVHDRQSGTTERVSVDSTGTQGNSNSDLPSISADGRFVAFHGEATNLVAGDTNAFDDVFVHDRQSGTTERVSVDSAGAQGNSDSYRPSISADGRFVAFYSFATNLVTGDTNGFIDIFVRDRQSGTTERASVDSGGAQGNNGSAWPSISGDGRFVAFWSYASNLVTGDTNWFIDVFVHDRQSGTTERVSVDSGGAQGNDWSYWPSTSADGRFVAFWSHASNLVTGDTNLFVDIFVRDRGPMLPGTDLCQPGTGTVIPCPCSNPPANAPRGCDNSSATGGAQLTSSGSASLALDTVVFVTHDERPTATSIVLQGNAEISNGIAFGQGVRCAGGGLKRLYTKTASGGSITAPGAGDPSVSARSAALGDTIVAGTSRWHAVYYRDPIVLGGCPATSTFNVTQTQLLAWRP